MVKVIEMTTPLLTEGARSDMKEKSKGKHVAVEIGQPSGKRSKDSCTIFKVNVGLRESNPEAYTPKLISIGPYHNQNLQLRFIGPYHNQNPQLCSMEKYKILYLERFLQREVLNKESCIKKLKEIKDEVLKCYDDIDYEEFDTGKFVEMLLLDGCFVVEYIREDCLENQSREGRIINTDWMVSLVNRDLLLLENQLPFSVLTEIHGMSNHVEGDMSFTKQVEKSFLSNLPNMCPASLDESTTGNAVNTEFKHLLHVLHKACQPSQATTSTTQPSPATTSTTQPSPATTSTTQPSPATASMTESEHTKHITLHGSMPNATELVDVVGVEFSKVQNVYGSSDISNILGNRSASLFDIKFKKGLLEIPSFEVDDITESLLRNLIAFEQHWLDVYPTCFSDYVTFMDYLIESEKDVSLLRQKGIIRNRIGEDKEVASIFNKMGRGVAVSSEDFYYRKECINLIQHYEDPRNKTMAFFWRTYCSNFWVGIASVGGIVLLILTAMQTMLAFKADWKKNSNG